MDDADGRRRRSPQHASRPATASRASGCGARRDRGSALTGLAPARALATGAPSARRAAGTGRTAGGVRRQSHAGSSRTARCRLHARDAGRAPSSGRGSALIAHQTTAHRYTTGIFRITSMKTSSQTTRRVYAMPPDGWLRRGSISGQEWTHESRDARAPARGRRGSRLPQPLRVQRSRPGSRARRRRARGALRRARGARTSRSPTTAAGRRRTSATYVNGDLAHRDDRLAAALPQRGGPLPAPDRRRGGRAGEARRARRPAGQGHG